MIFVFLLPISLSMILSGFIPVVKKGKILLSEVEGLKSIPLCVCAHLLYLFIRRWALSLFLYLGYY